MLQYDVELQVEDAMLVGFSCEHLYLTERFCPIMNVTALDLDFGDEACERQGAVASMCSECFV